MFLNMIIVKLLFLLFFLISSGIKYGPVAQSRTNFDVTKLEKCASDGRVNYTMKITKRNQKQFLDLHMSSSIPFDRNIGMEWSIESSLDGRTFFMIFTIREKDFCKAMSKYMGEFWYDIERAAQIPPGICPLQEGRYHVHNHAINYNQMSLQTFPFGILRLTIRGVDKRNNSIVTCTCILVNNVEN